MLRRHLLSVTLGAAFALACGDQPAPAMLPSGGAPQAGTSGVAGSGGLSGTAGILEGGSGGVAGALPLGGVGMGGMAGAAGAAGVGGSGGGMAIELEEQHFYGRWNLEQAGTAVTVNSGSHVTARFSG